MTQIIVTGDEVLTGKLRGIVKNVERTQIMRLNKAIDPAYQMALRLVPVRTGYLRSSIRAEVDANEARLVAEAPYAGYVEYGTSKMAARPYMRPAAKLAEGISVKIITADLATVINNGAR